MVRPVIARHTAAAAALLVGCASSTGEDGQATQNEAPIVGGQTTAEYPAVGAFTMAHRAFCTGTVIAPRVVLTAAHCLRGGPLVGLNRFVLGRTASTPQVDLPIERIVPHPDYDRETLANDIGVAILGQDAPVEPMALAAAAMDATWVGREVELVGYGVTALGTETGGKKRSVVIPIATVTGTQFSYTYEHGGACVGDSGGPAIVRDAEGRITVAGVTSHGDTACARFGVETRVDVYSDFIAREIAR